MQNVDIEMFGDFDLDRDRFSTIKMNDFETNTDVSTQLRFGVISDLEIAREVNFKSRKSLSIQRKTLDGHLVFSKTGIKRKTGVCHLKLQYQIVCAWMCQR